MNPLALVPAPYRLAALLAVAAAAAAGVLAWGHARYAAGDKAGADRVTSNWNAERAARAAAAVVAIQDARTEEQRRVAAQQENADEAERLAQRDRAARDVQHARAAAAADGLRDAAGARAAAARDRAASDPAAAGQCAADAAALADAVGACGAFLVGLARDADDEIADARRRGLECAADYDALTTGTAAR